MENLFAPLSKLVGLHRQLLETLRQEREALVNADKKEIQTAAFAKEATLHAIHAAERERVQATAEIALQWKMPLQELTLTRIIQELEPTQPKQAEQLRSAFNALTILIERVREANHYNGALLERALENILVMKNNVLGESMPKTQTYTQAGQKSGVSQQARLISKEA